MVKFRGIEISIISQFDIRKLPEFRFRQTSPSPDRSKNAPHSPQATASCYVPIYPGSQIWFEYAIDGPHPPKAAYFFKLLFNGKVITSFDCGSKHHYYGKMMYNLVVQGTHPITGVAQVVRQALHFTNHNEDCDNEDEDVIEFRVHRIEHRQRIQELTEVGPTSNINKEGKLQLADGGLLEPGFPKRRYRYQLLDPVDEPYATFKFFCRSHEYLNKHGIIEPSSPLHSSSAMSPNWQDACSSPMRQVAMESRPESIATSPVIEPKEFSIKMTTSPSDTTDGTKDLGSQMTLDKHLSIASDTYLPPSDSDEDLSIVARDSVEDLPSIVPRSPKSPKLHSLSPGIHGGHPTTSLEEAPRSPRRRLKKKLTINVSGAEFDIDKKKRPLSPFTSGGMLRRCAPPLAPPAVTKFGPRISKEVDNTTSNDAQEVYCERAPVRTTRAQRGGRTLMSFLGRRTAK